MKLGSFAVLVLAVAAAPACHLAAESHPAATDYVIFVDQTGSVGAHERAAWPPTADVVLRRLALGDSILILPVHDQTMNAAPLFYARVPAQGVSLEDVTRGKRRLKEIRDRARVAIQEALQSDKRARGSELLAIVDRVAKARLASGERPMRVYVFSDMLQSMPPINLERTTLLPGDIPQRVSTIGTAARWRSGLLSGVIFQCVLNGLESGRPAGVNDRRILEEFWRVVLTSVGAELLSFDTHL